MPRPAIFRLPSNGWTVRSRFSGNPQSQTTICYRYLRSVGPSILAISLAANDLQRDARRPSFPISDVMRICLTFRRRLEYLWPPAADCRRRNLRPDSPPAGILHDFPTFAQGSRLRNDIMDETLLSEGQGSDCPPSACSSACIWLPPASPMSRRPRPNVTFATAEGRSRGCTQDVRHPHLQPKPPDGEPGQPHILRRRCRKRSDPGDLATRRSGAGYSATRSLHWNGPTTISTASLPKIPKIRACQAGGRPAGLE